MILGYDKNPNSSSEQKIQSLMESVQMALNELTTSVENKLADAWAWIKAPWLHNSAKGTNTYYRATRDDTGVSVGFGIGSGGINHGIWSDEQNRWLIYGNQTDVFVGDKNMTNRWVSANSGSVSITATGQTINICTMNLPANRQYMVFSDVYTGKGGTLTLSNNIVVTSGTATTQVGAIARVTTSAGQGVANWKYIKTGSSAVTITLQGYSYPDGGTGYNMSGTLCAVML